MQKHINLKQLVLLAALMMPTVWCGANGTNLNDGYSHIEIREKIDIPISNQSVGTQYNIIWYNTETGLPYSFNTNTTVKVKLNNNGDKVLRISFPSAIRNLKSNIVTNTFGDAVFVLTKYHGTWNKKEEIKQPVL